MRYALLDYAACPACLGALVCFTQVEVASPMPTDRPSDGSRTSAGPGIGPVPRWREQNALTTILDGLASAPAPPTRGREIEVDFGMLICAPCGRWFPITNGIPELLPDHLRDAERESAMFQTVSAGAPRALIESLSGFRPSSDDRADPGAHHKKAEIGIKSKIDEPLFFVPGYSSPFAYWDSDFSIYLIKLFGAAAPLLNARRGDIVVDSGCGYAWTTEWLFKSGFDPIGVDICRTYLDIGVERMKAPRPHLIVGDVENLPLANAAARAVLAYESFHHVPDRRRAMAGYHRVLGDGGTVVLAEPGAAHEEAKASADAMVKYGILERGMELEDVVGYAEGTTFNPEQIFLVRAAQSDVGAPLDRAFVHDRTAVEGNLFRLTKGGKPAPSPPVAPAPTVTRRLKSVLKNRFRGGRR